VPAPASPITPNPPPNGKPLKLFFASSNAGKLAEFRALIRGYSPHESSPISSIELDLLPGFASLPAFPEDDPTFAENALGKALYYSQLTNEPVFADDSGLVVPVLGGAPGVHSARYAGPNATSEERNSKLLSELSNETASDRAAYFCCVIALVLKSRPIAIVSSRADGQILESPRGTGGFGYDPIFYFPALGKTFAELTRQEKNQYSHRGKAFRRLRTILPSLL
jgi:XTP/dITP diphosphohydrolase